MLLIKSVNCELELGVIEDSTLSQLLDEFKEQKIVILVDENTNELCLPRLINHFDRLMNAEIIVLTVGEQCKDLSIVENVWHALTEYGIGRFDLVINLGGGVISDVGGFIASCYKRGLTFINIPTTLLAMVDASIGGKTGINLGIYKNQIGVFSNPKRVFIDPSFLTTLPKSEKLNGYAEMIKHAVLASSKMVSQIFEIIRLDSEPMEVNTLSEFIQVKNTIVCKDFSENGERKLLNLGHTIGHAIEGVFMDVPSFSHGYCVAIGLLIEAKISLNRELLNEHEFIILKEGILSNFPFPDLNSSDKERIVGLLLNDKKNKEGKILSCLIRNFGHCMYDQEISTAEVLSAFEFFEIN